MLIRVKIYSWQQPEEFEDNVLAVAAGDKVIVENDYGLEMGEVTEAMEKKENAEKNNGKKSIKAIVRKATSGEIETMKSYEVKKKEAMATGRQKIKLYGLNIKLVGVSFSFDGSRVVFSFVSEKRVDFRELAKDLSYHFHKSVRLQQIGSRDEARVCGDYGLCGRPLCCRIFKGELKSVSTSVAHLQQIDHRGSARLSGLCGRLRCCLAFEASHYEDVAKRMPPIGKIIETASGRGMVRNCLLLTEEVEVELDNNNIVRVPLSKL